MATNTRYECPDCGNQITQTVPREGRLHCHNCRRNYRVEHCDKIEIPVEPILIRKSKDPFGWMGNMSPFPVTFQKIEFRTTEALFQSLRFFGWFEPKLAEIARTGAFVEDEIVEKIRAQRSPMTAKMVAKKHADQMVVKPCSEQDLENMRLCLRLKTEQHPELVPLLISTDPRPIIEDCTRRQRGSGLFWGAALIDGKWKGDNKLGVLWTERRNEMSGK